MGFFDDGYLGAVVRGVRWIDHHSYEKEQQLLDYSNIFDLSYCSQPFPLIKTSSSHTRVCMSEASDSSIVSQKMCNSMLVDHTIAEETDLHDIFFSSLGGSSLFLEEGSHSPSTVASSSRGAAKSEAIEVAEQTADAYELVHARQFSGELEPTSHAVLIQSVTASEVISTATWPSPEPQTNDIAKYSEPTVPPPLKDSEDQSMITSKQQGSKRRKGQQKRVVCVPMAGAGTSSPDQILPSDMWAWRKYGQKPIKGSPYPRGYYRCSSSKGCSARKQVERSRSDPSMLVITYTSEHNHAWPAYRNSLAGTTRSKYVEKVHSTSAQDADFSKTILEKEYGLPASPVEGSVINVETFVPYDDPLLRLENASISSSSHDQHLFQDLEALPELSTYIGRSFLDYRSYENTETIAVDPFDLFSSQLLTRE